MKITMDPMPALRAAATARVNSAFESATSTHRSQAHRRKKEIATAVVAGGASTPEFAEEAALRNITVQAFAELIAGKPDPIDQQELKRQKLLLALVNAKTPQDVAAITTQLASI